jgi:hypothetical protein
VHRCGYDSLTGYDSLIKRNKNIENNLLDKLIDNLIFHEGNISLCHQEYISSQTPSLNNKFVDVSVDGKAFKKDKDGIPFEQAHGFGIGYRHMCSFWFVDFWKFVEDYDLLLRIDEDCFVDFQVDGVSLNWTPTCLSRGGPTTT